MLMLTSAPSTALAEVLFRDDFDGDEIDPAKWICLDQRWPQGQTWFVGCPEVSGGIATFTHHTYNPDDPGNSCVSQSVRSKLCFSRGVPLEVEARIRIPQPTISCGLVAAWFLYMDEEVDGHIESDEIDFEVLSNTIVWPPDCGGHRVFVVTYDDFWGQWGQPCFHYEGYPLVPALDLAEWNVFKFRCWGDRINWYWNPTSGGDPEEDVLIYTTLTALADEPMNLFFNFWAALPIWEPAWCEDMQPAGDSASDIVDYCEVDYVLVRSECGSCSGDMDADDDVDLHDFAAFAVCFAGQDVAVPSGCEAADLDCDNDVDFDDFVEFHAAFIGPLP
jgi:hypothetical protein